MVRVVLPGQWAFYLDVMTSDQDADAFPLKTTAQRNSWLRSRTLRAERTTSAKGQGQEKAAFLKSPDSPALDICSNVQQLLSASESPQCVISADLWGVNIPALAESTCQRAGTEQSWEVTMAEPARCTMAGT